MMTKITLNKPIYRTALLRSALTDEQIKNRQAEFVISTESEDTFRTVFRIAGWLLTRYQLNPIVTYNHRFGGDDPDNVIAISEVFVDGDQLIGRATFESEDVNPKADKIFKKIIAGTLRMASITAVPTKGHWGDKKLGEDPDVIYFDEQELFEWAIVDIGSNPDAHKRNLDTMAEIRKDIPKNIETAGEKPVEERKLTMRERQLIINKNKYGNA